MSAKRIFNQGRGKQQGAVLMFILVIVIIGAAAILVNALTSSRIKTARQEKTAAALAQAKDALIGFAITYKDTHSGQVFGYLPCPDQNGGANEGIAASFCGTANYSQIGRLPWKTLGLPTLRDGDGECLWYAVAGTYKDSPKSTNTMMNWDNYGLFQILAGNGVTLAGQAAGLASLPAVPSNAVAVVFAPGTPLGSQNRASNSTAPICGGNYTAANYLDSDSPSIHNATPITTSYAISTFYTAGATAKINDQIIYITSSDIFDAIKKRNDFKAFVDSMLIDAKLKLEFPASLPTPVVINFSNTAALTETLNGVASGNLYIGKIPKLYLSTQYQNWRDNIQYGKCTFHNCLTVNGSSCDGIIIFAGERNAQDRTFPYKNTPGSYLESPILSLFSNGKNSYWPFSPVTFTGPTSYSPTSPSTDVVMCIL